MDEKDFLTDWLTGLLKGLVTDQSALTVKKIVDERGSLFTITVGEADRGRILGKKGQTAEAVRVVLRVAGFLQDVRAAMVIDIPGRKFVPRDNPEEPRTRPVTSY